MSKIPSLSESHAVNGAGVANGDGNGLTSKVKVIVLIQPVTLSLARTNTVCGLLVFS